MSKILPTLYAAWLIALISTLGALFIGEVMGQMPCVLCWYQRILMFPLAVILGIAVLRNDRSIWIYALPLAAIGLMVAGYHNLLYYDIIPEPITPCEQSGPPCSGAGMMLFGALPIPLLSLLSFTFIAGLLLALRKEIKL